MPKKKYTKEKFIEKSKKIHKNKYDYSKINEILTTKVIITCPIHGDFEQNIYNHLQGKGCPKCALEEKSNALKNIKPNKRNYKINNTEHFIEKAKQIHGNKYDYSKTCYENDKTKVCITCPIHGDFWMLPSNHIHKTHPQHCPKCSHPSQRKTMEQFIQDAKTVHGEKYDYSKVEYINNKTKVTIICPIHGEFQQIPSDHLKGCGCKQCTIKIPTKRKTLLTLEQFLKKCQEIHGDRYDYSKVRYMGSMKKITIICKEHGEFKQTPNNHLQGQGCPLCARKNTRTHKKLTQEEIINRFNKIHGQYYDYSKVIFKGRDEKVIITCPIHGDFEQTPHNHYNGQGCPLCAKEQRSKKQADTVEMFIKKAIEVHGEKYDYSKVKYINSKTKVIIICHKHGEFFQKPIDHLNGKGCKKCKQSHLERKVELFLKKHNIIYQTEYHNKDVLNNLTLDFFLPQYNIGIECQGKQHFQPIKIFGGEEGFKKTQQRDALKKELCRKHNIKLLYFSDKKYMENIITSLKYLLNIIKNM